MTLFVRSFLRSVDMLGLGYSAISHHPINYSPVRITRPSDTEAERSKRLRRCYTRRYKLSIKRGVDRSINPRTASIHRELKRNFLSLYIACIGVITSV